MDILNLHLWRTQEVTSSEAMGRAKGRFPCSYRNEMCMLDARTPCNHFHVKSLLKVVELTERRRFSLAGVSYSRMIVGGSYLIAYRLARHSVKPAPWLRSLPEPDCMTVLQWPCKSGIPTCKRQTQVKSPCWSGSPDLSAA